MQIRRETYSVKDMGLNVLTGNPLEMDLAENVHTT